MNGNENGRLNDNKNGRVNGTVGRRKFYSFRVAQASPIKMCHINNRKWENNVFKDEF